MVGSTQKQISTHAPRTGSDTVRGSAGCAARHFNPRSPHGERPHRRQTHRRSSRFQPTLPARGATDGAERISRRKAISTHAPRTGSDAIFPQQAVLGSISTHAPRTGSDDVVVGPRLFLNISTHAPRTGSDQMMTDTCWMDAFQPTLPARGATDLRRPSAGGGRDYFNPRSPHGERPPADSHTAGAADFNPRSPHGERLRPERRIT